MDATLKKILISPVKRDKDNEITGPATALISIEVPLDGVKQQEAIFEVLRLMEKEWIKVSISASQLFFPLKPQPPRNSECGIRNSELKNNSLTGISVNSEIRNPNSQFPPPHADEAFPPFTGGGVEEGGKQNVS